MDKNIYLIRHAQSQFNLDKTNKTQDCEITNIGIDQSISLGKELNTIQFDIVFISPLRRAIQTFQYAKLQCKKQQINYLVREHIADSCDLLESEVEYKESEEELISRCKKIHKLISIIPEKTIGIICHADLIFYLTSDVFDGERFGVWLDNAKYHHFTFINER